MKMVKTIKALALTLLMSQAFVANGMITGSISAGWDWMFGDNEPKPTTYLDRAKTCFDLAVKRIDEFTGNELASRVVKAGQETGQYVLNKGTEAFEAGKEYGEIALKKGAKALEAGKEYGEKALKFAGEYADKGLTLIQTYPAESLVIGAGVLLAAMMLYEEFFAKTEEAATEETVAEEAVTYIPVTK